MSNDFVDELVSSVRDPESNIRVASLLAKYAGQVIYIPVLPKKRRRIRAAEHMLANHVPPGDVVRNLVARFQVSTRTAERDVRDAKEMAEKNGGKR